MHTYQTRSFQDAETFIGKLLAKGIVAEADMKYSKTAKRWTWVLTWRKS